MSRSQLDLQCVDVSWRRRETRKSPLVSWAAMSPGRDKTKATFQLDRRHLRQSHKVKVKAARCRAEDGIVQTCLSTLDHAEPMSVRVKAHLYQPFGLFLHSFRPTG
ncbi:unnamed protein product [Effrenium voratum]|uniref:Uncharacterized protein n=1 Tax=Effrenium voratum TaxID=2562239 RepID=A0AA36IKW2_9DINO|nr:unnamed protein product [Effrenium voratum]